VSEMVKKKVIFNELSESKRRCEHGKSYCDTDFIKGLNIKITRQKKKKDFSSKKEMWRKYISSDLLTLLLHEHSTLEK
jgi:hypothetical protein